MRIRNNKIKNVVVFKISSSLACDAYPSLSMDNTEFIGSLEDCAEEFGRIVKCLLKSGNDVQISSPGNGIVAKGYQDGKPYTFKMDINPVMTGRRCLA